MCSSVHRPVRHVVRCSTVVQTRVRSCYVNFLRRFTDVLDRVVTFIDPVYIVGDINVRLDPSDEATAMHLVEVLSDHGLACRVSSPTHDRCSLWTL